MRTCIIYPYTVSKAKKNILLKCRADTVVIASSNYFFWNSCTADIAIIGCKNCTGMLWAPNLSRGKFGMKKKHSHPCYDRLHAKAALKRKLGLIPVIFFTHVIKPLFILDGYRRRARFVRKLVISPCDVRSTNHLASCLICVSSRKHPGPSLLT